MSRKTTSSINFSFRQGNEFSVVGITETFPHGSFKPIVSFSVINNSELILDGRARGSWFLYVSEQTGRKMLEEIKRIQWQIVNY